MALRLIEGWDYLVTADLAKRGWTASTATVDTTGGRRSTRALLCAGDNYSVVKAINGNDSFSELILGFAFRRNTAGTASTYLIAGFFEAADGQTGANCQLGIWFNGATRCLSVVRGALTSGGITLATDTLPLVLGQYYYIELRALFNNTTGAFELRVGGETRLSMSGVDTQQTAGAFARSLCLGAVPGTGGSGSTVNQYYDDIYLCDTTGTENNDFLGDCRVDLIVPTAEGASSDFTPSTGTDNSANVDETTLNAIDFNSSNVVGHKDSFVMSNVAILNDGTVFGAQPIAYADTDVAASRRIATVARSGATEAEGGGVLVGTNPLYYSDIYEENPNTSTPWTQTTINAAEFGVVVKT